MTDERGRYYLAGSAAARRLRVLRTGVQPADVTLRAAGASPREIALVPVPPLLAPVPVTAGAGCRRAHRYPPHGHPQ